MIGLLTTFRSSQSAANLQTVVSDTIARAFNSFGGTQAEALDIPKAFGKVWHVGFLHKFKSFTNLSPNLSVIFSFISNRQL